MYVFPSDDFEQPINSPSNRKPVYGAMDATIARLGAFLLAWTAGAGAAAFLALAG